MAEKKQVGIIMGSDSDLSVMSQAMKVLDEFGISYDVDIISAHREPQELFDWGKQAEERDYKVVIAGAGKAAALPGMCAALVPIPVIGIPMKTSDLGGEDSLISIVQMPSGIPAATVAINGAKNAGILAAKIIAVGDPALMDKVKKYGTSLKEEVKGKNARLHEIGWEKYLEEK